MSLLVFRPEGIYCPEGDFYIDPWRPVPRALITHAHSDHARRGMGAYLCHPLTAPVLRHRLSTPAPIETAEYGQTLRINGTEISLHPAGHIPGSAQIKVSLKGETWVVTGDFKTEADGLSTAFESQKCHTLISECTFGLPVYRWQRQELIFDEMHRWHLHNVQNGRRSVFLAYSLGKAQRIMQGLYPRIGECLLHASIAATNRALESGGLQLPPYLQWTAADHSSFPLSMPLIATPSAAGSPWLRRFSPYRLAVCSGWMQIRGRKRQIAADAGFALSDHADWPGLLQAVKESGCSRLIATHGYTHAFARYCEGIGIQTATEETFFGDAHESETEEEA